MKLRRAPPSLPIGTLVRVRLPTGPCWCSLAVAVPAGARRTRWVVRVCGVALPVPVGAVLEHRGPVT